MYNTQYIHHEHYTTNLGQRFNVLQVVVDKRVAGGGGVAITAAAMKAAVTEEEAATSAAVCWRQLCAPEGPHFYFGQTRFRGNIPG